MDFFLMLVFLEHALIILNMFLEICITDIPEAAVEGARNAADLIEQFEYDPDSKMFAKNDMKGAVNAARRDVYALLGLEEGQIAANDVLQLHTQDSDYIENEGMLQGLVNKGDAVPIKPFQNWMNKVATTAMGTNNVKATAYINRAEKKKLLREHSRVKKATLVTELPPIGGDVGKPHTAW